MAYKGKILANQVTGQQIEFIQTSRDTDGDHLEMISTYDKPSLPPVPHYHPYQEEWFIVLEGELTVMINKATFRLVKGDRIHIPADTPHAMWNAHPGRTRVSWKVSPALDTEYMLEMAAGLANDNKLNDKGMPDKLQLVVMANHFANVYRLTRPSYLLQKALFTLITPLARLKGYKPVYRQYID